MKKFIFVFLILFFKPINPYNISTEKLGFFAVTTGAAAFYGCMAGSAMHTLSHLSANKVGNSDGQALLSHAIAAALANYFLSTHCLSTHALKINVIDYGTAGAFYGGVAGGIMQLLSQGRLSNSLMQAFASHALASMFAITVMYGNGLKAIDPEEQPKKIDSLDLGKTGAFFTLAGFLTAATFA